MGLLFHRRVLLLQAALVAVVVFSPLAVGGLPSFSEVAEAVGLDAVHFTGGYDHSGYTGGGAVGDFNRDGWQDLFFLSGGSGGVADKLFINNGDGTFTDQAAAWGIAEIHKGKGAAVADFNGDGWLDIYVTSSGPQFSNGPGYHKLYRNNQDGTFTDVAASAGVNFTHPTLEDGFGACFGDYDRDGDLDLFVAGVKSNNSGTKIFRNNGNETFTDMTQAIGFFAGAPFGSFAFSPRFLDMDGDWYPEMLLVSDFGTTRYYRNNTDGTFTDITNQANVAQEENGMGQTVGDFNNDLVIDWYVTSIDNDSFWTGNKLYYNQGNQQFTEHAAELGVDDGGYGWGAVAVDFNHDGLLDIGETNGGLGGFQNEQSYLWIQNQTGSFDEMAIATGLVHFGLGRGMVNFDADNDGDQDVVIFANNDRLTFFRNDLIELEGADVQWLRVFLSTNDDPTLPPNGYGARVTVTAGGKSQLRVIDTGPSFLSSSEISAHFGLASATMVDEILVEWPNGTTTIVENVPANRFLSIAPGGLIRGDVDLDGDTDLGDFALFVDCFSGPDAGSLHPYCRSADFEYDEDVDFADFAEFQRSASAAP